MTVRRGEVTVLLGLLGSGKSELLESIFGARPAPAGATLLGEDFAPQHPAEATARGVYLVPESRHEQAIIPGWAIERQLTLPFTRRFSRAGLMNRGREHRAGTDTIERLGIVARSAAASIGTLSGGNQQKVVVGRWLLGTPTLLLLDEPFRGVDINARHDIGDTIRGITAGAAVVVATSDLDEALEVADRIVVLRQGRIAADLRFADAVRSELISAMSPHASVLLGTDDDAPADLLADARAEAGLVSHDPLDMLRSDVHHTGPSALAAGRAGTPTDPPTDDTVDHPADPAEESA